MKFRCRTNTLGLDDDCQRHNRNEEGGDGNCRLCLEEKEDIKHLMFKCPFYNKFRQQLYLDLENKLIESGNEEVWYRFMAQSLVSKLCFLLGDHGSYISPMIGTIFDRCSKIYIDKCFKARAGKLGLGFTCI